MFDDILEGIGLDDLLGGGAALAGIGLAREAYKDLGSAGSRAKRELDELATTLEEKTQFQPFTVTTATGGMFGADVGADGGVTTTMALSPEEQALQQQLLRQATDFYGRAAAPIDDREQVLFERMLEAQAGPRERERLALEERLASQGRLGVRTSQFGGTPEQLAAAKAIEEANLNALLAATGQAQKEQMMQAQLGAGMLSSSYVPQAQLLSGITPGLNVAEQARQQQLFRAGQYGETKASALDALLAATLGQADIYGSVGTGLVSGGLSGLFGK